MTQTPDPANYYWVIVEYTKPEESILGMEGADGRLFIPATRERAQGEVLLEKLPAGNVERSVEAMHREQLLEHAAKQGYEVFLVDAQGKIIEALSGQGH